VRLELPVVVEKYIFVALPTRCGAYLIHISNTHTNLLVEGNESKDRDYSEVRRSQSAYD
jgi:hypothetical protein